MASTVPRARIRRVEQTTTVHDDLAEGFLAVYREAFAPLERLSPARQALTDEEFLAAMGDKSVLKVVGWDRDGQACAMAILTTDLSTVPWISVPYFAARFPDHHRRRALYYFHAILVRSRSQGGAWARLVFEELTRMLARENAVAAFDCCNHTVEVTRLPEMIARVANRLCVFDPIELDRQHYFAYVFSERR